MSFWGQYLLLTTLLFVVYLCIRCNYLFYWKSLPSGYEISKSDDLPGQPIDTRPLSSRVERVRQDLAEAKVSADPAGFKRTLMVEGKRVQVAKLAFFHPSPSPTEPESHEQEDGGSLLLV